MTDEEVAEVLKAAADKLAEDFAAVLDGMQPPTPDEVAEYVVKHYTGLDWAHVTDLRAEFKDPGLLHISMAYTPPIDYIKINLTGVN